jgi:hypothetical protein
MALSIALRLWGRFNVIRAIPPSMLMITDGPAPTASFAAIPMAPLQRARRERWGMTPTICSLSKAAELGQSFFHLAELIFENLLTMECWREKNSLDFDSVRQLRRRRSPDRYRRAAMPGSANSGASNDKAH